MRIAPDRKASELKSGVNSEVDFRVFSGKICLIFVGRGGNFEFLRGLHHVGLFWEMALRPIRLCSGQAMLRAGYAQGRLVMAEKIGF